MKSIETTLIGGTGTATVGCTNTISLIKSTQSYNPFTQHEQDWVQPSLGVVKGEGFEE